MSSTAQVIDALSGSTRVVDLSRKYVQGMAQSPNHPPYRHAYTRRHGDMVRADGGSAAADIIVLGTHVGTHMDALAHVSHDGHLHGGTSVVEGLEGGLYRSHGIDTIEPFVGRGVLLDIPRLKGVDVLEPGYEITTDDLDAAVESQGSPVRAGDAVLIRSGWGCNWDDTDAFVGHDSGVPGVSEAGAQWLAERGVVLAGADTIAFECLKPGAGHALLPAHRVLLVEAGIPIMETMLLDGLAATGAHEFGFVVAPLNFTGATGSPIRPIAVLGDD